MSINELAEIIFNVFEKKLEIKYKEIQKGDIKNSIVNVLFTKNELGFFAKKLLKDELVKI